MLHTCPGGGIGRRGRFKTCSSGEGSSPSWGTMNDYELNEKFKKTLVQFSRDNGIKMSDTKFIKLLRSWFEYLSHDYSNDNVFAKDYNKDTPSYQKFRELHDSIINQCAEFIKSNDDVKCMIEDKIDLVRKEWNKSCDRIIFEPDVRVYFGIDGLDIKNPEIDAGSDSSLSLQVGSTSVFEIC